MKTMFTPDDTARLTARVAHRTRTGVYPKSDADILPPAFQRYLLRRRPSFGPRPCWCRERMR